MFRPFRRHGPSPFEVMSSTWRDSPRDEKQAGDPAAPSIARDEPKAGTATIAPPPSIKAEPAASVVEPAPASAPKAPFVNTPAVAKAPAPQAPARSPAKPPAAPAARAKPAPAPEPAPAKVKPVAAKPTKPAAPRVPLMQRLNHALASVGRLCATRWAIARTWSHRTWTKFQSRSRITRTHLGITGALFGFVIILYLVGNSGKATAPMLVQDPAVTDNNLAAIQPPLVGLPGGPTGQEAQSPGNAAGPRVIDNPAIADANRPDPNAQPKPKMTRGKLDSREKGLRYYILATYSVNKEEYMLPLLEYLWSQGVEAGAFNAHNSGYFQVIALQGFSKDQINAGEHKKYEDTLRRIGRLWKAEGGGDDNLSGMYIAEHKGVPLNMSITKAN